MKVHSGIFLIVLFSGSVMAQEPAHSLKDLQSRSDVHVKDPVRITDINGNTFTGRIANLSANSLRLESKGTEREIAESMIREVKKRRFDRWWDGTIKGAAAGATFGVVAGTIVSHIDDCDPGECGTVLVVTAGCSGIGAGVGTLIDAAIRKYDIVFTAPAIRAIRVMPLVAKDKKGIHMFLSF